MKLHFDIFLITMWTAPPTLVNIQLIFSWINFVLKKCATSSKIEFWGTSKLLYVIHVSEMQKFREDEYTSIHEWLYCLTKTLSHSSVSKAGVRRNRFYKKRQWEAFEHFLYLPWKCFVHIHLIWEQQTDEDNEYMRTK